MKVLVTGGAGYIGSIAVEQLIKAGEEVVVFDNLYQGHQQAVHPKAAFVQGDLADRAAVDAVMAQHKPDAIMHFASHTLVGESMHVPGLYWRSNLVGTHNIAEASRIHGVRNIVFSSTCATYGDPEKLPLTEDHPQRPVNPYGHTKLAFEYMLRDYAAAYGIGFAALRYFNAAGASVDGKYGERHDPETHLIPLVLQVALGQRSHIDIFGTDYPTPDGTCVRDYIHVEDLAEAHLLALEKIVPGQGNAFNVGTGTGHSVRAVVRVCEAVTGKAIAVKEGPRRAGDPPVLVAGSDKIRQALGWSPKFPDLQSIVETAWDWHRTHPKGY